MTEVKIFHLRIGELTEAEEERQKKEEESEFRGSPAARRAANRERIPSSNTEPPYYGDEVCRE